MANWITQVADEKKRLIDEQERAATVAREIKARAPTLMKELESRVRRDVDLANQHLYNSAKVFEVRHDMGLMDEDRANDFVAMTADYPAATMYVKLHPEKRILARSLYTKYDSETESQKMQLRDLALVLDENNVPFFFEPNEKLKGSSTPEPGSVIIQLDLDDVARLILEPVVIAHAGRRRAIKIAKTAQPVAVSPAQRSTQRLRFGFVHNSHLASILERDYAELQSLDPDKSTKSVLVLSGGIIEGLLFDALVASGTYTFEAACNEPLKSMIYPAMKEKIIRQDKLTDVLRSYRNLIHPAREVKDNLTFTSSDAKLAIAAVDIIMREVMEWHTSRKQRVAEIEQVKARV